MRNYDAVIFDLDGTLLNTLDDLADSVNHALMQNGLPCRSIDEVRKFVGNGVANLVARAVPEGTATEMESRCLQDFQAHYRTNLRNKTAPYPGVVALLERLKKEGCKLAVVSNKFEDAVKVLCPLYFGDLLDVMTGESGQIQKKPAPDMVCNAMAELGVTLDRTVYVGDSDVDIETAQNAGLPCISVTWGFRDRAFLQRRGGKRIVDNMAQLEALLLKPAPTVRKAVNGDLNQVLALYAQLHNTPLLPADGRITAQWARMLAAPGYYVSVAELDGRIQSTCTISIIENLTHNQRPYALVENVVTARASRGMGLASACLRYVQELAQRAGAYKIMLLTGSKEETTLRFYEKAGFNRVDKTAFIQWL